MTRRFTLALSFWAIACSAQTTVNGGRVFTGIVKSSGTSATVDFSGAASTVPVETGVLAARPSTCTVGQMYFATDATAGQNLSYCTGSPGTWTAAAGSSTPGPTVVQTNQSNAYTVGTQDFSGAAHTLPARKGTTTLLPSTCTVGEEYFATDATAGQNKYYCTAANTWTQQTGGASGNGAGPFSALHSGFTPYFNPEPLRQRNRFVQRLQQLCRHDVQRSGPGDIQRTGINQQGGADCSCRIHGIQWSAWDHGVTTECGN